MGSSSANAAAAGPETVDAIRVRLTRTRTRTRQLAPRALPDQSPERIDRYVILRRLGVGGMGVVYEALDERVGRAVALKLMLVGDAEVDRERLRREAQALARLSHPNVVEVFEIGEHHDPGSGEPPRAYVAMELVDGHSLDRWLRLRRRSPAEIVEVFAQAGEGLAAAHARGLVHRDFKPGNVLVGNDGRVRVVDFGLVRESDAIEPSESAADRLRSSADPAERSSERVPADPAEHSSESQPRANWSGSLTKTGAMVGTPAYMSPEQLTNLPIGPASDQFSFCVALYEALFGRHPFVVNGEWSKLPFNVLDGAVLRPPPERRVPGRLTKAVLRGLAVRPEQRWPSMDVLLPELRRGLERRGPRPLLAVLATGVAALGLYALATPSEANVSDRCEDASATMNEAWGPQVRQDLREAWLGTGRPSDADTWSRVEARMQAYSEDWWSVHRAACSGPTRSPSSATCLVRLAESASTRLQVMAQPNDSLLDNAVTMMSELPPVDPCRAALDAPPGALPSEADEPSWSDELEHVDVLLNAGRNEEAHAQLDELLERAERESNPRLAAEAKVKAGYLQMNIGDIEGSAKLLEEAYLDAKHLGRDRLAARASLALLLLFGTRHYREAEATRWARHARAEAERVGDPHLTVSVYNAQGRALRSGQRLEDALALHEQALALQRSLPDVEDSELAASLFQIGSCLGMMNRVEEGHPYLEQALGLQEAEFGSRHPRIAASLINIGVLLMVQDDMQEALEIFERALDIMLEWSPDNPGASWALLLNISSIHRHQGHPEQAADTLRQYLEIVARSPNPDLVDPSRMAWVRGEIAFLEQRYEEAILQFERAALGDDVQHYERTRALINVATALQALGRLEEAVTAHRRAMEALEPEPGVVPSTAELHDWQVSVHGLAHVLARLEDHEGARRELARAHDVLDMMEGKGDPIGLARIELQLGAELTALGRQGEAIPPLQASVRILEAQSTAESTSLLVQGLVALAEAELETGARAAALEHAERATGMLESLNEQTFAYHAPQAWFLLARCLGESREQRGRARSLARRAQEHWAKQGEDSRLELETVRAWLDAQR